MRKLALVLCGILVAGQGALANSIGIGYSSISKFYKAEREDVVLPLVDIEYDDFFVKGASTNGIKFGYKVYEDDLYTLSLHVKPLGGYKIDSKDMLDGYQSIDDRKHQIMGGAEATIYTGFFESDLTLGFDYGENGGNIHMQLSRPYFVNSRLVLIPSINYTYFNSDYVDYYVGVEGHEAQGKLLGHTYDGDSAYSFGANLTANYGITDNFSVLGFTGINKLSSEFSNSPIIDDNYIYFIGAGVSYTL